MSKDDVIDLSKFNADELKQLRADITEALKAIEDTAYEQRLEELKARAADLGIDPASITLKRRRMNARRARAIGTQPEGGQS